MNPEQVFHPDKIKKKKKGLGLKIFLWSVFLFLLIFGSIVIAGYHLFLQPNIVTTNQQPTDFYIRSGSDYTEIKNNLISKQILIRPVDFEIVSQWMRYPQLVKPGRYIIHHQMNNLELVRLLRSGAQTPVMVTFNNMRDVPQLAGRIAAQLEVDSAGIVNILSDEVFLSKLGYNKYTIPGLFIPNTYQFYWTTTEERFVMRMAEENLRFWNSERLQKAKSIGFTKNEVITLASIIEKETNKNTEKETMAGVYINRLKKGWPLQADPTLVFASGDFEIRRVLDKHKSIESPYNTYLHTGLPPGPICIPGIASIDAVLNHRSHSYFFFCAREDLSGYHTFAETYAEHERNASRYRKALDRLNIKK